MPSLLCCGARGGKTIQGHPLVASIPIALLLEFVIIHITGVVQTSFAAGGLLFYGIPLDCTEHSFQYRV